MVEKVFIKAKDIQDVILIKSQYGQRAKVLAGGTDLMVKVNTLSESPECFIYVGEAGLNYINEAENKIIVGAATTLSDIIDSKLVQENLPMLAAAVSSMASAAIRNKATIGGNICNASPAADTAVPLLVLQAKISILGVDGERTVEAKDFFTGPGRSVLTESEIVKEIIIPKQGSLKWAYKKLGKRKADTLSIVCAGLALELENGICKDVRIALGAVAPTPILAEKAAALLKGQQLNSALLDMAAEEIEQEISPIDDQRSSAWYRKRATKAIVKSMLEQI